jgi:hypothetical protein
MYSIRLQVGEDASESKGIIIAITLILEKENLGCIFTC